MVNGVRHSIHQTLEKSLEILKFPSLPRRIQINDHSHYHSHKGDVPLDVLKTILGNIPIEEAYDLFRVNEDNSCVRVRTILPLPEGIKLENRLIKTDKNSAVFYAKRARNGDGKKFGYRKGASRLVLNGTPTIATHVTIVLESYERPKSGEIIFKLITAFPSGDEFSPPEPWDLDRIEEFGLDYTDVCDFWNRHALCVQKGDLSTTIDPSSIHIQEQYKELIRRILEGAGKLQSKT